MKVYILTEEPYHDNGTIVGVYDTEEKGISALRMIQADEKWLTTQNGEDYMLTEWDIELDKQERTWYLKHDFIMTHGPLPWRKEEQGRYAVGSEYTLEGPRCSG